jgi:hypothetical protein
MDDSENVRRIEIPVLKTNKKGIHREHSTTHHDKPETAPKKKVIIDTDAWIFEEEDYEIDSQRDIICRLFENIDVNEPKYKLVLKELQKKISGYRGQDILKELFDPAAFVDIRTAIELLYKSELLCFYCREPVKVIYENVREPKQWSLERINNQYGHNCGNLEIACLSCNVRRGTMYHERYVFTKQMSIVKKDV